MSKASKCPTCLREHDEVDTPQVVIRALTRHIERGRKRLDTLDEELERLKNEVAADE